MIKLLRFLFILSAIVLYTGCSAFQEKAKDKYIADYENKYDIFYLDMLTNEIIFA